MIRLPILTGLVLWSSLLLTGCPADGLKKHSVPSELCDNLADDDGDGRVDCDDSDCLSAANCLEPAEVCANGADDDGDGAVDCFDPDCTAAPECAGGACSLENVFHDGPRGCNSGYTCALNGLMIPVCTPDAEFGSEPFYGACSADLLCPQGSTCLFWSRTAACMPWCTEEHPACPEDVSCVFNLSIGSTMHVCLPLADCDPVAGTGCPDGRGCVLFNMADFRAVCLIPGTLGAGAPCDNFSTCSPGHVCPNYGPSPDTCNRLCDPQHPCASGTCQTYPDSLPEGVGLCVP